MKTMIRNKSVLFLALASVVMMSACSSEEETTSTDNNELTDKVMYATAAYNDGSNPQSRVSYEDNFDTNYLKLAWSEGDKFSAFTNGSTTKYDFTIQAPTNRPYTANETFKCDNFATDVTDGTTIDAIYPAVSEESVNPANITLNLDTQMQYDNKSTAHLKNYDYMVGHATYSKTNPNELNFNFKDKGDGNSGRLASIYRIKVMLPSTVTSVKKIEISCTDEDGNSSLVTSKKVNFTNGSTSYIDGAKGKVTLYIIDGVPIDGEFVAYVMLFPSAVKNRTIIVTTTDGGKEKRFMDTKTYESEVIYTRGQFKYINTNLYFIDNYVEDDYVMWSEKNCKTAPSLEDIEKYLGAGVYLDDDDNEDGNMQTYIVNGEKFHYGLWMKKMEYIGTYVVGVRNISKGYNEELLHRGRPSKSEINQYFFLPAAGGCTSGKFIQPGLIGDYWLNTPPINNEAKVLTFDKYGISVCNCNYFYLHIVMVGK